MPDEHCLTLMENALDSLNEGLAKYEAGAHSGEPRQLKFAVLNMAHFIELLLQKHLADIHPLLIYQRPFDPNAGSPKSKTISMSDALNFLQNSDALDPEFHADIDWLRKVRNQITHFEFALNVEQTKDALGRIIRAATRFADAHNLGNLRDSVNEDLSETFNNLLDEWQEKLRRARAEATDAAELNGPASEVGQGYLFDPLDCDLCGGDGTVAATEDMTDDGYPCRCFVCEETGHLASCEWCAEWFPDWSLVPTLILAARRPLRNVRPILAAPVR